WSAALWSAAVAAAFVFFARVAAHADQERGYRGLSLRITYSEHQKRRQPPQSKKSLERSRWFGAIIPRAVRIVRIERFGLFSRPSLHEGEDRGKEQQRGQRAEQQPADDGAAERRDLLAAFADAERHGQHTGDHGAGGHQDRPEAMASAID